MAIGSGFVCHPWQQFVCDADGKVIGVEPKPGVPQRRLVFDENNKLIGTEVIEDEAVE